MLAVVSHCSSQSLELFLNGVVGVDERRDGRTVAGKFGAVFASGEWEIGAGRD